MKKNSRFFLFAIIAGLYCLLAIACKQNVNAQETFLSDDIDLVEVAEVFCDSVCDSLVTVEEGAAGVPSIITQGKINDKIRYELDEDGYLVIYGEGHMTDFEYDANNEEYLTPWRDFKNRIISVSVEGPSNVGEGAFYGLPFLKHAQLCAPISQIGDKAFTRCKQLREVTIRNNLDKIGQYAFSECSNLSEIEFPSRVYSYGREAFSRTAFEDIDLPDGATSLPPALFYECENLENVELPSTLKEIEILAFAHCKNLEEVDLPEGLTKLDIGAFLGTSVDFIAVPRSVTQIIHFGGTPNIKSISLRSLSVPHFIDISSELKYRDDLTIYVPKEAYSTYKNDDELKELGLTDIIKIYPTGQESEDNTNRSYQSTPNNYPSNGYSSPSYNSTVPASHSGHYETRQEKCSSSLGKGYTEKMVWHGGDRTSTVRLTCHTCHGSGVITTREFILDH